MGEVEQPTSLLHLTLPDATYRSLYSYELLDAIPGTLLNVMPIPTPLAPRGVTTRSRALLAEPLGTELLMPLLDTSFVLL